MKILKIHPHPDVMAGSERAMHVSARSLQALGHRIYLVHGMETPSRAAGSYGYAAELSVPVLFDRRSKLRPAGLLEAEAKVDAFIREHGIDIVHVHLFPRTETLRRLARRHRTAVTVHVSLCPNGARYLWSERRPCERGIGLGCLTTGYFRMGCGHLGNQQPMRLPGFVRGMAEDHMLRKAVSECARVIVPSEWLEGRLAKDGIAAEKIRTVHNGFDDTSRLAIPPPSDETPAITFVGRLVDFKGPDHLLRASASMTEPHRVWFIGDGPMRAELEALTDELDLRSRVTFFGSMPPEEIDAHRRRSTVIVVPSLGQEVFSNVGPEALLLERPVVAYGTGGTPEWLQDGVSGRLVTPGDVAGLAQAIEGLLKDPAAVRAMGRRGRDVARKWLSDAHAAHLTSVYAEILHS